MKQIKTDHAMIRQQQRSIDDLAVVLINHFGALTRVGGGCHRLQIPRKNKKRLENLLKHSWEQVEKLCDMYLIESSEGVLITVAHDQKKRA